MCNCLSLKDKFFCSAGHPETLPKGYYYKEGYLFNSEDIRTTKEEGKKLAKEMWENVLRSEELIKRLTEKDIKSSPSDILNKWQKEIKYKENDKYHYLQKR
jgi:hypothetical protein